MSCNYDMKRAPTVTNRVGFDNEKYLEEQYVKMRLLQKLKDKANLTSDPNFTSKSFVVT